MRPLYCVANWKMNKTIQDSVNTTVGIIEGLGDESEQNVHVVIAPQFLAVAAVSQRCQNTVVHTAAQNLCAEAASGAYTGEVSAEMILDAGAKYVIVGHSERRTYYAEEDFRVGKKVARALESGLVPILCVGETLEERERGLEEERVGSQIKIALYGLEAAKVEKIIIAYEPVWAIGTGKSANAADAQKMHQFIRSLLTRLYDEATATKISILYGGSVKPDTTASYIEQPDIDGVLVGGASLESDSFLKIIEAVKESAQG